jgi:hypothetical protein
MSTQFTTEQSTARAYADPEQHGGGWGGSQRPQRGKPFFLTSEFLTLLATIAALAIAAAAADNFDAPRAWTLITIVAAAYIISRGLSKIGHGNQ